MNKQWFQVVTYNCPNCSTSFGEPRYDKVTPVIGDAVRCPGCNISHMVEEYYTNSWWHYESIQSKTDTNDK